MSDTLLVNQLDAAIDALLSGAAPTAHDPELTQLLAIAAELRALPDPAFRDGLKADLVESARPILPIRDAQWDSPIPRRLAWARSAVETGQAPEILPALARTQAGFYPVQRSSFVASVFAHAVVLALLITSGIWAARSTPEMPRVNSVLVTDIIYPLPPASIDTHGGGGGGDHDPLQASKGVPPRFSDQQIAPPAIVVRAEQPKLQSEPTVIGPPKLSFPQTASLGDPLSAFNTPSNGNGSGGGIGSGSRGGVGPGNGPGVGPGSGGGIGDGPYVVGSGVTAPRAIYDPEPDYSEEARKQKYQGTVVLQLVVGADGRPSRIRVVRSLGLGLDEKAVEAVNQWRFEPGNMSGHPVAVVVNVQINFRLY